MDLEVEKLKLSSNDMDLETLNRPELGSAEEHQSLELHKAYRDYTKHEDELINQRVSRTLLAHGFLIASYVILLRGKIDGATKVETQSPSANEMLGKLLAYSDEVIAVIPLIGVGISLSAILGVFAAVRALQGLQGDWNEKVAPRLDSKISSLLPGVSGAGRPLPRVLGYVESFGLLLALSAFWAYLFTVQL